jgi:hypothetical protein
MPMLRLLQLHRIKPPPSRATLAGRSSGRVLTGVAILITAACNAERPAAAPTEIRVPLFARSAGETGLGAHLSGRDNNPPDASQAQGQAIFRISDDGMSIQYTLIAANIENAFMAHIHMAPAGSDGPVVEWLFPSTSPNPGPVGTGRFDGVLAQGTFTAANLVGPLAGHPLTDLVAAMESGNAYVNIHTNDGVPPVANEPGDMPAGEIRGQLGGNPR